MIYLYRFLIVPLMILLLPLLALFNAKVAEGLRLRRQKRQYPEFAVRPIWIHAASGEFEYAKSVIRELKSRSPHVPIVVTYFSPTYTKNVQNFPGVDFALPLPLDLPGPISSFLRRLNPSHLLLARTDFWPELLTQTRARKIPITVFSFTQKNDLGFLEKFVARWRLGMVDKIFCVSPEDKTNIEALGVRTPTEVLGDTRYDQVRFRLDHPKELPLRWKPPTDRPCLVAGSTWAEDEEVLLQATRPLLKTHRLRLILVPHEPTPEHVNELKQQMQTHGIPYALFSSDTDWGDKPVLLVDTVGWLAELYSWGDMAFVGGSFRRTVHSVMEALGAGLKTFVGPLHLNNREAIDFQKVMIHGQAAVTCVHNADEWTKQLESLDLKNFSVGLRQEFAARMGATNKLSNSLRT